MRVDTILPRIARAVSRSHFPEIISPNLTFSSSTWAIHWQLFHAFAADILILIDVAVVSASPMMISCNLQQYRATLPQTTFFL